MKRLIFAASMSVATPVAAERYKLLAESAARGTAVAIDLDSITLVNGKPRAWVMVIIMDSKGVGPKATPIYSQSLYEFDCKQKRSQTLARKIYGEGNVKLGDIPPEPWTYPTPHTPDYQMLEYGCGKVADDKDVIAEPAYRVFKMYVDAMRSNGTK
jgi:hypothetical protein